MNSGYNPVLFTPMSTARKQMSSNTPEFFFGGSQIPTAMRKPVPIPKMAGGNISKLPKFKR